jgi:phage FluMu gp28-like protein
MNDLQTPEQWLALRQATIATIAAVVQQVGLPAVLLLYQQNTAQLLDTVGVSVLVIEKSRRVGETWGLAAAAVLRAAKAKSAGGMDVIYISYSQDMTREFIDACAMWAKAFSIAAGESQEFLFEDQKEGEDTRSIQAFRIRFDSGFEILGLSSAPRSLRGKQGLVIIDEAAFVDSLSELLKAALALLMWGGQVVICSTHNGTDNPFNQLVQDVLAGRKKYSHIHIDFDKALADGLFKRICLVKGDEWTLEKEAAWRAEIIGYYGEAAEEELFCVPAQGTGSWLTGPLIESRMVGEGDVLGFELPADYLQRSSVAQASLMEPITDAVKRAVEKLDPERIHALGFDFARKVDLSVVTVLQIAKNLTRREKLTLEIRRMPYNEQLEIVEYVFLNMPRRGAAAFDATGAGEFIAEAMGRKYGFATDEVGQPSGPISAIKFSTEFYRVNMPPLKAAFEDGSIELIKNDDHVSDLRQVKVVRGVPQVLRDERTGEKNEKRHGDFAIALALAWKAAAMRFVDFAYTTATKQGSSSSRDNFITPPSERFEQRPRNEFAGPLGAGIRGSI